MPAMMVEIIIANSEEMHVSAKYTTHYLFARTVKEVVDEVRHGYDKKDVVGIHLNGRKFNIRMW